MFASLTYPASGQINRRKHQQDTAHVHPQPTSWPSYRNAPYVRGRPTARGRGHPPHRNRCLILNNSSRTQTADSSSELNDRSGNLFGADTESQPKPATGWIAKHDRHRQLINPAVYDKEMMTRTRDMEMTRIAKARQRDEREKIRFAKHLQNLARIRAAKESQASRANNGAFAHEVDIQGARYKVTNGGSRLVKITSIPSLYPLAVLLTSLSVTDTTTAVAPTPKKATVGGVTFFRSKHGNLYRSGVVRSRRSVLLSVSGGLMKNTQRRLTREESPRENHPVKKSSELCKRFTTTGSPFHPRHANARLGALDPTRDKVDRVRD